MTPETVLSLGREALYITLLVSAPILGGSLLIGLLISVFQATTQIQEQTLTFVPKIVVVLLVVAFFGPWMLKVLSAFTTNLFINIPHLIK